MKVFLGILIMLHGIAHTPGFLVTWRLVDATDIPFTSTVFGGRYDLGETGIRVLGVIWLLLGLIMAATGIAALKTTGLLSLAIALSLLSLVLCMSSWPQARIGVFVNIAVVALVIIGRALGWV